MPAIGRDTTRLTHTCPICVLIRVGKRWLADCCLLELLVEHTALFCMGICPEEEAELGVEWPPLCVVSKLAGEDILSPF